MPYLQTEYVPSIMECAILCVTLDHREANASVMKYLMDLFRLARTKEEKEDYRLVERTFGSFQRSLRLPFAADADAVKAHFKDGVLKVVLAKPPEVEAKTQKVAIKSASG